MAAIVWLTCIPAAGQGGKAEPKRIKFVSGTALLTGTLSNTQEAEYVFSGEKDQTVMIRTSSNRLFDYRIFSPETDFDTEFDSSPSLTIELPAAGEYLLYVRKKIVHRPRTARFRLRISVGDPVRKERERGHNRFK